MSEMSRKSVLELLAGEDRRSTGRSDEVARMVTRNPRLFRILISGLCSDDALVRMRAADAAEKVTRGFPALLQPHKKALLGLLAETRQQEVRWHVAVMIPRLELTRNERRRAAEVLETYLEDHSSIVKTFALQGLADLAQQDHSLREPVIEHLRKSLRRGTPAMNARSRRLLARLS